MKKYTCGIKSSGFIKPHVDDAKYMLDCVK